MKKKLTIILLTMILLLCAACSDVAKYSAESERTVKVAVITGGHDFDRKIFFGMFDSFDGIEYTHLPQKDHSEIFEDISHFPYDVIVLYNMTQKISPKRQANFIKLLNKGTGLVAIHHSIGAFDDWQEYRKIIGGKFYLEDTVENGVAYKKLGYKHDVNIPINIKDKRHPITMGLEDFMIHDETYKNCLIESDNHILLTTDNPASDKSICWTRKYGRSKVFYIQQGHGPGIFKDENYKVLVTRAIKWSASELN